MADKKRLWRPGSVCEPRAVYEGVLMSSDVGETIERVREGVAFDAFARLRDLLDMTELELADVIGIPPSTLHRRKQAGTLSVEESERVVRVARLLDLAMQTMSDADEAVRWLKTSRPVLGDETPLERASTEIGARQVEDVLGRIEYGVYS